MLADDLNRLVKPAPTGKRLPAAVAPLAIRAKTGLERPPGSKISTSSVTVESTDGLFLFEVTVANE